MAERRPRVDGRFGGGAHDGAGARAWVVLALLAGIVAVGLAMLAGLAPDVLEALAGPPAIVRAALAGLAIVAGARMLLSAVRRIDGAFRRRSGGRPGDISDADLGAMVRGVRLVFLAAAAFTAAGGWMLGEPLPLVIALVIAGVDVVETSFLLLVASHNRG